VNSEPAENHGSGPPPAFAARMAILYSALFLHVGIVLPYFPLWMEERGLSASEISLVLTMPLLVRIVTSGYISAYADRASERANVLIALFAGTAILVAAYPLATGFWTILLLATLVSVFNNPMAPVMDAITLAGVRRFGFDYGRIRLWGSLVFIVANVAAGQVLARYGDWTILWMMIATAFAGLLLAPLTPRLGSPPKPATKIQVASASPWNLLRNRRFRLVAIGTALIQGAHAMIYSFGSIYWNDAGYSGTAIGLFWGIGVLAEVLLFQFSKRAFRLFAPITMIAIGAAASVLRWSLTPFEAGFASMALLQAIHGLTFGAVHLGQMHFYNAEVPEERMGAAQAVGFVAGAVGLGTFTLLSGPLYEALGARAFLVMAAASAVGLVFLLAAMRIQPQSAAVGGKTLPSA
jgi:MFS transporter, PPP family, 3-phenylpropionic acid transporter